MIYMVLMPFIMAFSDLDRIQTCNLLSRNQMRYSVAPRGLFNGVQIYFFLNLRQNLITKNNGF